MDLKLLKTFISVAKHSSFTEAAKELFIAQSAVSKHINQLEQEMDTQLFLRDSRKVQLTFAGRLLYQEGVEVLSRIDLAESRLRELSQSSAQRLSVGVFSVLACEVTGVLREFKAAHPEITVSLECYEFSELIRRLEDGMLDVIFTMEFAVDEKAQLCWEVVKPGRIQVAVGRHSPLASRASLRLSDLADYRLCTMQPSVTPDGYVNMQRLFALTGFRAERSIRYSSHESMLLQLALHDDAYSLLSEHHYKYHPEIVFIPVEDAEPELAKNSLVAVWHEKNKNPGIPLFLRAAKMPAQKM